MSRDITWGELKKAAEEQGVEDSRVFIHSEDEDPFVFPPYPAYLCHSVSLENNSNDAVRLLRRVVAALDHKDSIHPESVCHEILRTRLSAIDASESTERLESAECDPFIIKRIHEAQKELNAALLEAALHGIEATGIQPYEIQMVDAPTTVRSFRLILKPSKVL